MIDHVILTVSDYPAFSRFLYQGAEATWDHSSSRLLRQRRNTRLKGFGVGKRHFFWLKEGKPDPQAITLDL